MKRATVTPENAKKMAGVDLLDRLLEQEGLPEAGLTQEIPLDKISPDPDQPRKSFSEGGLQELAASIKEVGVLQPIIVSRHGRDDFRLVTGERRWRAAKIAGLVSIPAIVVDPLASDQKLVRQIIENIQREDLNDLDRAQALEALKVYLGTPWEEVAQKVGLTESRVHQLRRLKHLVDAIQEDIRAGQLTEKDSRPYQGLTSEEQAELHLLRKREGLTTQEVAWIARRVKKGVPGYSIEDGLRALREHGRLAESGEVTTPKFPGLEKAIAAIEREWESINLAETDREALLALLDALKERIEEMRATVSAATSL
jgi:ParB family chromosome partitioning protein